MKKRLVLLFLLLFFMAINSNICEAQIYKWVDEKGTVHFSDGPPSGAAKVQDKSQDKSLDKKQDKNQVQKQVKNQENKQPGSRDKTVNKQAAKEDAQAILKNLEIGNRYIPDDMKKYGPSGGYERPRDAEQTARSPTVRRTSS